MTTSRIDTVCCDVACGDKVLDCRVVDEVDLTMDASVDHRMIMMTMHVDVCVKEQKRARREAAANPMMLNDPSAKTAFQRDLWRFLRCHRAVDVDEHQLELTRFVRGSTAQIWQCTISSDETVDFGSDLELAAADRARETHVSCCVRRGKETGKAG